MYAGVGILTFMSFICGVSLSAKRNADESLDSNRKRFSDIGKGLSGAKKRLSKNTEGLSELIEEIEKTKHWVDD